MLMVLIVYIWESVMDIPSLIASHFSSCCCESTWSLCTPISILLICYWTDTSSYSCCLSMWLWSIGSSLTWLPRHTYSPGIHTIGCLPSIYRAAHYCSERLSRVSLWVRVPWKPCMKESNPDDKGLSLYWYAIKTRAVAGYQWM